MHAWVYRVEKKKEKMLCLGVLHAHSVRTGGKGNRPSGLCAGGLGAWEGPADVSLPGMVYSHWALNWVEHERANGASPDSMGLGLGPNKSKIKQINT